MLQRLLLLSFLVVATYGRFTAENFLWCELNIYTLYQSVFIYMREVYRLRAAFPKSIKHDRGQEVCESSIKLLKCVVLANGAVKKETYLNRLILELEVQWALLRLLYELKAVSAAKIRISNHLTPRGTWLS